MNFNLFALTSDPANRIVRFVLSSSVQADLTACFREQESQFNQHTGAVIPFDGKYKPDQGEILEIDSYDDLDGLDIAIRIPLSISEVVPTEQAFSSFKALFVGYVNPNPPGNVVVLLQNFDRRKILSTGRFSIYHAKNVYQRVEGVGLTIDTKLAGILDGASLKFFSFHSIRQIFDMSEHFRVATDADIQEFGKIACVKVADNAKLIAISDEWVRRKFSLVQQSQILESIPLNEIKAVASEFNIPLQTIIENGREFLLVPSSKSELKTLLRFLDEDYYKSPLSKTHYLTNSKRAVTYGGVAE